MRRPITYPTLDFEHLLWQQNLYRIAGVDEVGRGALAGVVMAAAVILPPNLDPQQLLGVRDSKQLSRSQREVLARRIRTVALAFGLGGATAQEIDRLNIRRATALAMQRALNGVAPVDHILVDGLPVPELSQPDLDSGRVPQTALIKGDQRSLSIAAASILAKVARDQAMAQLEHRFPGYGWIRNVGYATVAHRLALQELGLTRHHRRTFIHLAEDDTSC